MAPLSEQRRIVARIEALFAQADAMEAAAAAAQRRLERLDQAVLAACGAQPTSPPAGSGLYLLANVTGQVQHKRPSWKDYLPLSFGSVLDRDDLLKAAADGSGVIVCADLSVASVPAGYQGAVPCPQKGPVLVRDESLMVGPRRGAPAAAAIPYVLSPRHTFLLDAHPLLRWYPSAPAGSTYTVRVQGEKVDWQVQTTASEVRYPDDAPPLQAGQPYRLTVTDDSGRSSSEEQTALDLGFVVLVPDQAQQVQALLTQAQGLGLDERAGRLLQAEIYTAHGLRAEASAVLQGLPGADEAPTVQQRLGDLYLAMGLYNEARAALERAGNGYQALGDKAGQAAALASLGLAFRGNGDDAAARTFLEQARALFQEIGDTDGVARVDEIRSEIPPPP